MLIEVIRERCEPGFTLLFEHTGWALVVKISQSEAEDLHDDLGRELQCEGDDCPCWEAGQLAMADAVQPLEK